MKKYRKFFSQKRSRGTGVVVRWFLVLESERVKAGVKLKVVFFLGNN